MTRSEWRTRLRDALLSLIQGQMTNDDFDCLYYDEWADSPDRAVAEIGKFGWGLYSSDLPLPYRLTGRYAVNDRTRQVAERCLLFLANDLEYGWPEAPGQVLERAAGGCAISLGLPLGIALLLVAGLMLATVSVIWFLLLAVPGGILLGASLLMLKSCADRERGPWRRYWAAGDREAWPFLRREEYSHCSATSAHLDV